MQLLTFPGANTLMDVQATHGQKVQFSFAAWHQLSYTHRVCPRPARAVAKLWCQIMNLDSYLEWQTVWELTRWFAAHLYDAVRLARHLAVVERPHTHSHFHRGHAFSIAASEGSLFKLLRWCKDQIVSKIAVVHTSTHQTGSWLCSRKFACQISESPSSASYGKRFACACAVRLIANCETRMGEWVKAPRA